MFHAVYFELIVYLLKRSNHSITFSCPRFHVTSPHIQVKIESYFL